MYKKILFLFLFFPALAFSNCEGRELVKRFWKNTQEKRMKALDATLSSDFQGLFSEGAITRREELGFLKVLPITNFVLSHVRTTKAKHRLIVTYDIQIIDGATSSFFHELYVYVKQDSHWKLVAISFAEYTPTS